MKRDRLNPLFLLIGATALIGPSHAAFSKSDFVEIFDGKSLEGWDGDPRFWQVEDGAIVGESTEDQKPSSNTFLIWEGGEVADFELKVEFKLRNHNSGIQYRSFRVPNEKWVVGGYQADIANPKYMGIAYGERYKGILAQRGQKTVVGEKKTKPKVVAHVGDSDEILSAIDMDGWNEYHIIAVGNQVIQKINGVTTAEFSENAPDRLKSGLIALQLHSGPAMQVKFRNIRLRELEPGDKKQVLFLAGKKSHGYGAHEHNAGCHLLARCLNESDANVIAQVEDEAGWPEPWVGYDKPDTVVMYCDGFKRHMAKDHQDKIQKLVDAGVGVACLHFATEVHPDELGAEFLEWIGGYFEIGWSVNPFWTAEFKSFPDHPIANGVEPFAIRDEWYYHMRFQPGMKGVTPILSANPPIRSLTSRAKDRNRGSNPTVMAAVEAGEPQHVAWAYERPGGGRGFGFTGGHMHGNWQHDDFRKIVLNAIAWTAKANIPAEGIRSRPVSDKDLELNQDYQKPNKK
ncbi:MAG TPA: family 16 glycoside hydrolase [Opitutales bacterium]|nr:family 16 glycoside hydrolase [Opitutales bacterium]